MAKDKRSFFERLTGAVHIEDEDDIEVGPHKNSGANAPLPASEDAELSVDVYQTPDEIVIKTMTAGVRPEDLDISKSREMVTIRGKREETRGIQEDNYFHKELFWGAFSRTIILPQEIDIEAAEAVEKHGLLILKLPKLNKEKQAKVKVRSI